MWQAVGFKGACLESGTLVKNGLKILNQINELVVVGLRNCAFYHLRRPPCSGQENVICPDLNRKGAVETIDECDAFAIHRTLKQRVHVRVKCCIFAFHGSVCRDDAHPFADIG